MLRIRNSPTRIRLDNTFKMAPNIRPHYPETGLSYSNYYNLHLIRYT